MTEQARDWLSLAKGCFETSTSYMDANWRKTWERNISLFQSRHPDGSKYNTPAFKHRSRYFRPKTKSVVRKNEAAAAAAFFSNADVVTIEPQNDADDAQRVSAELMNELLNYRLENSIPWYLTLLGAFQDAQVMGVVASYQYWMYREKATVQYQPVADEFGQPMMSQDGPVMQPVEDRKIVDDKPCIDLIPLENLRFDPGANWTAVVKSSPYVIRCVPMYVADVKQRMVENGLQKPWKQYEDGEIRAAMAEYDATRVKREEQRQDPLEAANQAPLTDFEVVWCHENFVRMDGEEFVYWTLGTQHMLTEPEALESVYFHGERPIVIGCAVFEAHRAMPESIVGVGSELQRELNDTANQRRDNVSLVLNKRWLIKRGAEVDVEALMRNVPGGGISVNDVDTDVKELNFPDVTASAYAEQDRLNVDFDELTGNFSQSSVATNRSLNETVGGMRMLGSGAQQLTEYLIRTFAETWVEPVLKQLVKLEQKYETDTVILGIAGQRAELAQKYGVDQVTDELLDQTLTVRVNVGLGATDPQAKLQKFNFAATTLATIMQALPDADPQTVRNEVFALAGYKNGDRFFAQENSPNMALMQKNKELEGALQELGKKLTEAQLAVKDKTQNNMIGAFDAETKRLALLKEDPPQPEAPGVDVELLKREFEAMLQERLENLKAANQQENELMKLAAGIIQAQISKPAEQPKPSSDDDVVQVEEVAPDETRETMLKMMAAIENLASLITAPKIILRDQSGRAYGSRIAPELAQ